MQSRRHFLGTSLAAFTASAVMPANARTYEVPQEHLPVLLRITKDIAPGEIHLDPNRFYLFWTLPDHMAIRYRVGVGKPGLYESGEFVVGAKKEWPSWKPTKEMIERNPAYKKFEDGMPGGPKNPLGACALYLFDANGRDTFLRIHGTPDPWTIGSAVSNGCARLINSHAVHLYDQVPIGARVVLYPQASVAK